MPHLTHTHALKEINSTELWSANLYLGSYQTRLKLLSYAEVEQLVDQLAEQTINTLGRQMVMQLTFYPIPRGGHIVMGLLSYALGLYRSQGNATRVSPAKQVALVDDCALTGHRFREMLVQVPGKRIYFLHLLSAKALRERIMAQESAVIACIAARDLVAQPNSGQTEDLSQLKEHWDKDRYLVNTPIQPIFPWNEPTMPVVMPFSQVIHEDWHLFPPHLVYKNKYALGLPPQPVKQRCWMAPARVAYRWDGETLTIMQLDHKKNYLLNAWGAGVWRSLSVYGDEASAIRWISSHHLDVDEDTIVNEFRKTRDQLLTAELLIESK